MHGVLLERDRRASVGRGERGPFRLVTDRTRITSGAMARPQSLTDAGVSDREVEVLALVGEHLTNVQIAGRLFISVRTVESHVSSLLRKLDLTDRRALAEVAGSVRADRDPAPRVVPALPAPLTTFVGRATERATLGAALAERRLVTAVGPGGVGKTRLAVSVAADLTDRYADGAWYVDLVPVTELAMVGTAVAKAFGIGEQPGRSPTDTVLSKLAGAEALVVLDNCEHVRDGVTSFVERLLAACPRITLLATSRARLMVPFEWVFTVPGLSLPDGPEVGESDAVALFVERAAMAGWRSTDADDRRRIAAICDEFDGIALAIELAAARLTTFGLDGLEAGLGNRLGLLTGGSRLDERHQTVRSALDWSFGLLDESDQVALRRAAVFATPFTREAAATVVGTAPLASDGVAAALARLADHSLLEVIAGPGRTRYRMLETIRQYGAELMAQVEEEADVRRRHLRWCLATAAGVETDAAGFDEVADDLRAGLGWASGRSELRDEARALALRLARLTFGRGMASEAQRRYEEAARLASDPADAARALHLGASVAWGRAAGNEAIRLYRAAADAAREAGDPRLAAVNLATAAELMDRSPGLMSELPAPGEQDALLAEAGVLAFGDPHVEAAVLTVVGLGDGIDPASAELTERAVELARRVGDARLESAALDQVTAARLAGGEFHLAAAAVRRRIELLTPLAHEVEMAWEYTDTFHMAPMVYLAIGDLETARRYAQRRRELPLFRQADHMAVMWQLTTAALVGDFDEAVTLADQFRHGWIEAGRPTTGGIACAPAAAAMVFGIRGDDAARRDWLDILTEMRRVVAPLSGYVMGYRQVFDGIVSLHHGEIGEALTQLADRPEALRRWSDGAWRQWYAAVWAETAVLAELPDRRRRIEQARFVVAGNPIAAAIVDRAEGIDGGDRDRLLAAAAALGAAGCSYQRARTLVLAGGDARAEGEAILAANGAAPMVV